MWQSSCVCLFGRLRFVPCTELPHSASSFIDIRGRSSSGALDHRTSQTPPTHSNTCPPHIARATLTVSPPSTHNYIGTPNTHIELSRAPHAQTDVDHQNGRYWAATPLRPLLAHHQTPANSDSICPRGDHLTYWRLAGASVVANHCESTRAAAEHE